MLRGRDAKITDLTGALALTWLALSFTQVCVVFVAVAIVWYARDSEDDRTIPRG